MRKLCQGNYICGKKNCVKKTQFVLRKLCKKNSISIKKIVSRKISHFYFNDTFYSIPPLFSWFQESLKLIFLNKFIRRQWLDWWVRRGRLVVVGMTSVAGVWNRRWWVAENWKARVLHNAVAHFVRWEKIYVKTSFDDNVFAWEKI